MTGILVMIANLISLLMLCFMVYCALRFLKAMDKIADGIAKLGEKKDDLKRELEEMKQKE